MIADLFFSVLNTFLKIILYFQPHWNLPDNIYQAINWFNLHWSIWNDIIPLGTFFLAVLVDLGFVVTYYGYKVVVSVMNWFRGSGGIET